MPAGSAGAEPPLPLEQLVRIPALQCQLCLEAHTRIAHARDRADQVSPPEDDGALPVAGIADRVGPVPPDPGADVVDGRVVVTAPEEGNRAERLAGAENAPRGRRSESLGEDPVLDSNALTGPGIGPASEVPGGPHPGHVRPKQLVDEYTPIAGDSRSFGEIGLRPHADPNDRVALDILANLMPSHRIVGIHAVDLVWGLGTLHCLTQQEPAPLDS